jgi:O-antigen/teichoic acid export membrane protein
VPAEPIGAAAVASQDAQVRGAQKIVIKNTLFLMGAQVFTMPISVLLNAVMARYLGPGDYGYLYLGTTFISFGFIAVEWGQGNLLPALIAKARARAGEYLGTTLAFRFIAAPAVAVALAAICLILGYQSEFLIVLALMIPTAVIATVTAASCDTIRGFERTDVAAYAQVGGQILNLLAVVPTLLLGGTVRTMLLAQLVATGVLLPFVWRVLKPVGVGRLSVNRQTLKLFFANGFAFMSFNIAMALHTNVDAVFLSKLAPPEVVGWHAVARRLVGLLLFPAVALISSLYPTLARLHAEDMNAFRRTARGAIGSTAALAIPMALGCALYPDIGVRIFSRESFGPAEDNLRVMAIFLVMAYFSMPIGSALLAAGRERAWAVVQFASVGMSLVLDPILIPWFQAHRGNGGLGVAWTTVACELMMVCAGIALMPRGVFDRSLWRALLLSLVGAMVMAGAARLLSPLSVFIAAPIALAAYALTMWFTGGVDRDRIRSGYGYVLSKFKRR